MTDHQPARFEGQGRPQKKQQGQPTRQQGQPTRQQGQPTRAAAGKKPDNQDRKEKLNEPTRKGLVKAVLSGQALVLGAGTGDLEQEVVLTGIRAPQICRTRDGKQEEEPFGWISREFLRKLVIGKTVTWKAVNRVPFEDGRSRAYCIVKLDGKNLSHLMLENGMARVHEPPQKEEATATTTEKKTPRAPPPERAELLSIQKLAETHGYGMHNKSTNPTETTRFVNWNPDPEALIQKRNVPLPGVIDRVIDGSYIRVELSGDESDPLSHQMINLYLAGVDCPQTPLPQKVIDEQNKKRAEADPSFKPGKPELPAPFSIEAQKFVEARLLHRDVKVVIQGIDKSQALYGTLVFEKGNISEKLLEQGLGTFVPWSASLLPPAEAEKLQKAEASAKSRRLGIWSRPSDKKDIRTEFTGTVLKIASGDRVEIENKSGEKKVYFLASIRAPRSGGRDYIELSEPHAFEAREYLRKNLIGADVKVVVEYDRAPLPENDRGPQVFVSLYGTKDKRSFNEQLVANGLASPLNHRRGDERASNYPRLIAAEAEAIKRHLGIHNHDYREPTPPMDVTRQRRDKDEKTAASREKSAVRASRAQGFLTQLKGEHTNCIVEHVFSASRFKLHVPTKSLGQPFIIAFALFGVTNNNSGVISEKATEYVTKKLYQREVSIKIDSTDKSGAFRGTLLYGAEKKQTNNLSLELLREGWVKRMPIRDEKSEVPKSVLEDMEKAENEAKEAKKNMWEKYDKSQDVDGEGEGYDVPLEEFQSGEDEKSAESGSGDDDAAAKPRNPRKGKEISVRVTEIIDAANFYVHFKNDPEVESVLSRMKKFDEKSPVPSEGAIKKGAVFAGLFNDGTWHRVRIENLRGSQFDGFFIDYGNNEVLESSSLRVLDADLAKTPGVAHHFVLTSLKAPGPGNDNFESAGQAFSDLTWDKDLTAQVEHVDAGKRHYVTLHSSDSDHSINDQLLEQGWVEKTERSQRRGRGSRGSRS